MDYICILLLAIRERYLYVLYFYHRREGVEERVIVLQSRNIEWWYRINLYLPPYEFEIGLYMNFGKWWNVKFQAK